ncbi:DHHW family protein [uncultured Paenibacillus sp.]|uniref:DHHW family protein n=1 Tax=uncultured Paenibacillus sp. TaxID=227322 RepID=UPI0028039A58|nr:DHHW family protein [uncultured Paenibacillus sp.]
MRKVQKAVAVMLLVFICALSVAGWLTPDRTFSPEENRMLDPKPKFSLHGLTSGKIIVDYEKYVSDQFPFRDFWIGVHSDMGRALGQKESNGVYLGQDGYLIQQFQPPAKGRVEENAEAIRKFAAASPNLQIYVMLAPTSFTLNKEKLPAFAPVGDELASLKQMRDALGNAIKLVDVYPALSANRQEYLYYRTDHHWTTLGAYYAYRELCKQMGIVPQAKNEFELRRVTDQFYGSLYSKSGFKHLQPDEIELWLPKVEERVSVEYADEQHSTESLYAMENLNAKDKYAVFLNGNHGFVKITSNQAARKKLLIVKDSYANSLIPFLTKHFSEIDIVDLRYYDGNLSALIRDQKIRDVLVLYNINTFFTDPSIQNLSEMIE